MLGHKLWRRVRRIGSITVALAALVLILMWMAGAFHPKVAPARTPARHPTAPMGRAVAVQERRRPLLAVAVGTVQARHRTEVASKLLASIKSITVRAGQPVSARDELVYLDDRDLKAQQNRAKASVVAAEANKRLWEKEKKRGEALLPQKNISQTEFDQIVAKLEVAEANLTRARESLNEIGVQFSYTVIKAPVSGTVIERMMEAGDMAAPGKPILSIYDPSQLRLEARVGETLIKHLTARAPTTEAATQPAGQQVAFRIDAVNLSSMGTVEEIVPQADVASRTLLVKVALPAADVRRHKIYPGMFGRLFIEVGTRQIRVVPAAAVQRIGQLEVVWLKPPSGPAQRRFVKTGERLASKNGEELVEVLSGLDPGQQVIVPREPSPQP